MSKCIQIQPLMVTSVILQISVLRDKRFENAQTANLAKVVSACWSLREILAEMKSREVGAENGETSIAEVTPTAVEGIPSQTLTEKLQSTWLRLQNAINCVVDSNLDKMNTDKNPGIKQVGCLSRWVVL